MRVVAKPLLTLPEPDVRVWVFPLDSEPKHERRAFARDVLRSVLAAQLRRPLADLAFTAAPGGKPQLVGGELQFNLSHSGEVACVAASPAVPVGVDVERVRTFKNVAGMRRRICSAAELAHLDAIDARTQPAHNLTSPRPEASPAPEPTEGVPPGTATDSITELIRLWVRKEAVVKASGEGIVRDLNAFSVLDELVDDGRGGRWRCLDLPSPASGYLAAVAFPET